MLGLGGRSGVAGERPEAGGGRPGWCGRPFAGPGRAFAGKTGPASGIGRAEADAGVTIAEQVKENPDALIARVR
jgi:hypothetical protein